MLLRQEADGGVDVLAVAGPVAQPDVPRLVEAAQTALAQQPCGVVIDLRDVTSLAPDAVRGLCELAERAPQWPRAALCLCGAPPAVERALRGVVVHRTRQEALALVHAQRAGGRRVVPIEHSARGPGQARRAVAECFARLGLADEQGEDLLLVVSEMVTNAVRHGAPPVELEVVADEDTVRIAVTDSSPTAPQARVADPDAEGGRGMALVDVLCTEHGVRPQPPGKEVWGALRRHPEDS